MKRLSAAFADGRLEHDYRQSQLGTRRLQTAVMATISAATTAWFAYIGTRVAGGSFDIVFLARLVMTLASMGVIVASYRCKRAAMLDKIVFGWALLIAGGAAFVVLNSSANYREHSSIHLLVVLLFYLAVPNRLAFQIVPSAITTASHLIALTLLPVVSANVELRIWTSHILVQITGIFVSYRLHYVDRRRFAARRRAHELAEALQVIANTDPLTGIPNRRHTLEFATAELKRHQSQGHGLALLLFDIDHFKSINDTFGHKTGDLAIQSFALLCDEARRESDLVGRIGGEEFLVVLPSIDLEGACSTANEICQTVRDLVIATSSGPVRFTVSVGVSTAMSSDKEVGPILERADRALYAAKEAGRDQVIAA